MYWLCFPHALFMKSNYHSWIFALISNSECEVIDPNFDLHPFSGSGLIISSDTQFCSLVLSFHRDCFLYCWLQLSNGFDVHLHLKHTRDIPDLKGQRWDLHSKMGLVMKCSCAFMCVTATRHPRDEAVNCRFSLRLQDATPSSLDCLLS